MRTWLCQPNGRDVTQNVEPLAIFFATLDDLLMVIWVKVGYKLVHGCVISRVRYRPKGGIPSKLNL